MRLVCVVVAVASLLTENLTLPVGKEGQREDVVTRCLIGVLSKALSKPDSQLDQQCKDILQAGVKYAPLDKKTLEGAATHGEVAKGQPEVPDARGADVKDIEALLKSIEEKREIPEDERSQESWSLGDEKEKRHENGEEEEEREKRSGWKPGRYHQRKHKRGEEEEDYERSQESWGGEEKRSEDEGGEEREKRARRPGTSRYRKYKRDEETLGEEREEPQEERSQENWEVVKRQGDEDEDEEERHKRIWKPTHRYHHKKKFHKRSDEPSEVEEDGERSQESWGVDKREDEDEGGEERAKRARRPGSSRYRKYKRDEETLGEEREEPQSWGVDKRDWRAGRFHQRRHKRDEELSEADKEEPDEERSQEYWDFATGREKRDWRAGRFHQRRHKRDEELSEEVREEPDEERSQESWGLDKRDWRAGRFHQRRHKRDEEVSGEAREEPDEERSQEYWDFDTGREKREWRAGRFHQRRHKRDEELSEGEPDGERSQEDWGVDKRSGKEEAGIEKRIWKPTHRYHHKKKFHKRGSEDDEEQREDSEEDEDKDEAMRYLAEKRNPWIFRGFYHPAWYKRDSGDHTATSNKMDELAKLLSYKVNQLAHHSTQEEPKRSMHQRALTQQEETELENLAAMDTELQRIAAKLHDDSA